MASVNKVLLMGNLTRDPELRYTPKGTAVCNIGLAVNERRSDGNGGWKESTTFIDVTVWGHQAESVSKYLTKGRAVFLEGRLQLESWEKYGEKRSKMIVIAENVQFLPDGKGGDGERPQRSQPSQRPQQRAAAHAAADTYEDGDAIPF